VGVLDKHRGKSKAIDTITEYFETEGFTRIITSVLAREGNIIDM
jgi:hypothetical protein